MNLVNKAWIAPCCPVPPQSLIQGVFRGHRLMNLGTTGGQRVQATREAIYADNKGGQHLRTHLDMADLYLAVRSDRPGIIMVAASENAYCSCAALQAGHCFTVRPLAIFCGAGDCVSLVHLAIESKRVAGDWFAVSLKDACNAACTVLAEELVPARWEGDNGTQAMQGIVASRAC